MYRHAHAELRECPRYKKWEHAKIVKSRQRCAVCRTNTEMEGFNADICNNVINTELFYINNES